MVLMGKHGLGLLPAAILMRAPTGSARPFVEPNQHESRSPLVVWRTFGLHRQLIEH